MTPDRLFIALGLVIRRQREAAKRTQEEFAHDNGLTQSYYGRVERGDHNLTLWNFFRIAEGLGIPASKLLKDAERLDLDHAQTQAHRPPRLGRPRGSKRRP